MTSGQRTNTRSYLKIRMTSKRNRLVMEKDVSHLQKASYSRKISESKLSQMILVLIVGYLLGSISKPKTEFEACFDTGVMVYKELAVDSEKSEKQTNNDAIDRAFTLCDAQE